MLIDEFLPIYDFNEVHGINIRAKANDVFRAVKETNFCESPIICLLFRLRGLPSENVTLSELRKMRFETLGELTNKEILLGLAGKFWKITGDLQKVDAENFRAFNEKGFAKAVWDFSLNEHNGETHLTTETRIKCTDAESRRSFGFYWTFIRPFSGVIRQEILKRIKKNAEASKF